MFIYMHDREIKIRRFLFFFFFGLIIKKYKLQVTNISSVSPLGYSGTQPQERDNSFPPQACLKD